MSVLFIIIMILGMCSLILFSLFYRTYANQKMGKRTVLHWWVTLHFAPGIASTVMFFRKFLSEGDLSVELFLMGFFFIITGITMSILAGSKSSEEFLGKWGLFFGQFHLAAWAMSTTLWVVLLILLVSITPIVWIRITLYALFGVFYVGVVYGLYHTFRRKRKGN